MPLESLPPVEDARICGCEAVDGSMSLECDAQKASSLAFMITLSELDLLSVVPALCASAEEVGDVAEAAGHFALIS